MDEKQGARTITRDDIKDILFDEIVLINAAIKDCKSASQPEIILDLVRAQQVLILTMQGL